MCVTTVVRLDRGYSACVLPQTAHAALRMVTSANVIMNGFAKIVANPIISAHYATDEKFMAFGTILSYRFVPVIS
jgi:hypothetical protein